MSLEGLYWVLSNNLGSLEGVIYLFILGGGVVT